MWQPEDVETDRDPVATRQRSTRQGAAVIEILEHSPGFLSAQELFGQLRAGGYKVGLATVYRHLQLLADMGSVDAVRTDGGETLYRRCASRSHHHHLVCRTCGRTEELEAAEVEKWAEAMAKRSGFVDLDHTVEVFGTCPGCARR